MLHGFKKTDLIIPVPADSVRRALDGALREIEDSRGNEWIAEVGDLDTYRAHPAEACLYGQALPDDNESLQPAATSFEYTLQFGE